MARASLATASPAIPNLAGARAPEDVIRYILELAVASGNALPWRLALVCKRLRVMLFESAGFWSLEDVRALQYDVTRRFSVTTHIPPTDVSYALRAFALATLGPQPDLDTVVQVGQLLRVIEDELAWGWAEGRRRNARYVSWCS
ncbi:hypothetical protein AURDEDRAFT_120913 [Auricularia subglabra TFB-10046 SS5]|nr:hypothetical protein AURDEDRAFT_120913 [Auricularia subglabra TFB-10046 SS5]